MLPAALMAEGACNIALLQCLKRTQHCHAAHHWHSNIGMWAPPAESF